jgi:hypothetical protein
MRALVKAVNILLSTDLSEQRLSGKDFFCAKA